MGDPARAHARLGPLVGALRTMGAGTRFRVLPDAIEALISLGELDRAEPLIEELDAQGRTLDRAWALATATRCRALLAAARGDPPGALGHLQRALQEHQRVAHPFELARTLRAQGMVLRRDKHKAAAKAALEQALAVFKRLGAPLWAQATKAELGRVGLRPAAPVGVNGVTAAEARVAELVAAGRTNREVAGELFMSPKTVEAHLSRIYRKLGVRSPNRTRPKAHTPQRIAASGTAALAQPVARPGWSVPQRSSLPFLACHHDRINVHHHSACRATPCLPRSAKLSHGLSLTTIAWTRLSSLHPGTRRAGRSSRSMSWPVNCSIPRRSAGMRSETAVRRPRTGVTAIEEDTRRALPQVRPSVVGLAGLEPAASSLSAITG